MQLKTIWANEINQGCSILLDHRDILYIKDNIIAGVDSWSMGLHRFFEKVGTPHCVISELCVDTEAALSPVPIYSVPFRCMEILPINFSNDAQPEQLHTDYCFSFAVKKKTVHRHIFLKLIEYFKLTSYDGTFGADWRDYDMSRILEEMQQAGTYSQELRGALTGPIGLPRRWIESPISMLNVWKTGLNEICQRSAVHVINETISWEQSSMFSEKTLHAIMGLNFPLWVGGYGNAAALERMGFDVFNDVIDHSYQYHTRLIDRCYWAIELNRRILQDLDYARYCRQRANSRLRLNFQRLHDGTAAKFNQSVMAEWPTHIADPVRAAMQQEKAQAIRSWHELGFVPD